MRKFLVLLVAASVVLVGCSRRQPELVGAQSDGIAADHVLISHMSFVPRVLTIQAGQAVTWVWDDGENPHNVSLPSIGVSSGNKFTGSWSYTFSQTGIYSYRCTLHNNMYGEIIVK